MEHEQGNEVPEAAGYSNDVDVSPSDKYVTVSNGSRRVEVPDGEGYLKAVEQTPDNGLPDGRYDLSKAIEASRQTNQTYDGQVLHKDTESVYHLVGEEVVKHSMFELAKHSLPEIGARMVVSYASGVPHLGTPPTDALAAQQAAAHRHRLPENADARYARAQVEKDLQALFAHDPRNIEHAATQVGGQKAAAAGAQFDVIRDNVNGNADYAGELKRQSPDLFEKTATAETKEKIAKAVEVAERADQLNTLAGKGGSGKEESMQGSNQNPATRDNERERRGYSTPAPIKTSVEARANAARDLLNKAHGLQPMVAHKQIQQQKTQQQPRPASHRHQENTTKAKRGMSR